MQLQNNVAITYNLIYAIHLYSVHFNSCVKQTCVFLSKYRYNLGQKVNITCCKWAFIFTLENSKYGK